MKVIFKLFAFCFILLCFNSCKKDEQEQEKTNYMDAKVNGALWTPGSSKCILLVDTTNSFRIVDFTASSSGKTITIEAFDNATGGSISSGTRTLAAGSAFFGYNASTIPYHALSGSINITSVEASSQLITGSFDFIVEDNNGNQVHVSDGRFVKLSYSVKTQ